jgi:thiol-disulfide isomerase/thioredoxin
MSESMQDSEQLEALADPGLAQTLAPTLQALEKETELLLFVTPGCAVCPHQLRSAATVALASEKVILEVVDATREPELAAHYEVASVPTTVVDDELIMVGVIRPDELALRLIERQGPDEARRVFSALVAAGHVTPAAERLADGRGMEAFLELWGPDDPDRRTLLLRIAEESLMYDPFGLGPLAGPLLAALEDGGALAGDDDTRADTATLLGLTGDDDARPTLERLAGDEDGFVARAARAALDELDA